MFSSFLIQTLHALFQDVNNMKKDIMFVMQSHVNY